MKKTNKKLQLSTESVRNLSTLDLNRAAGGGSLACIPTKPSQYPCEPQTDTCSMVTCPTNNNCSGYTWCISCMLGC